MPPSRIVSLFFVALLDERMTTLLTQGDGLIAGSRFRLHTMRYEQAHGSLVGLGRYHRSIYRYGV
jgi:hypothetical protein